MAFGTRVYFEPLRTVAAAGIGAGYAAVGTQTVDFSRQVAFFNSTDTDLLVSLDGVVDHLRIAAGSGQLFDFTTNKVRDDGFFVPKETFFYVRRAAGAPTVGNFWIEVIAASGGV